MAFLLLVYALIVASDDSATKRLEIARTLVAQMADDHSDKAVEPFDETMKRVLPAGKLKEVWGNVTKQHGPLKSATQVRTEKIGRYEVVYVTCEFRQGKLDAKVVFTPENKITGLFFVSSEHYRRPAYVSPSKFDEREVTVGKGFFSLPGTLSLPKGQGPFPGLVLVHGSGPNDRDETIGPNKPFRDSAHGLASRGIAVLRYEKRTRHYPTLTALMMGSLTVQEETVEDAVAAVDTLAAQEKIDRRRIFVLGHSLGGMLLPRIGRAKHDVAGFIGLAGATKPLEDKVLEQTKYLLSLQENATEEEKAKSREIERQVAKVRSPDLSVATPASELPLGVPAKYWLDLRGYRPAEEAKDLRKPLLFLQGERDYQVTMDDFAGWKKALSVRADVAFITYPKLNHLFIEGAGKSRPDEYLKAGSVAEEVIADIARWVEGGKTGGRPEKAKKSFSEPPLNPPLRF